MGAIEGTMHHEFESLATRKKGRDKIRVSEKIDATHEVVSKENTAMYRARAVEIVNMMIEEAPAMKVFFKKDGDERDAMINYVAKKMPDVISIQQLYKEAGRAEKFDLEAMLKLEASKFLNETIARRMERAKERMKAKKSNEERLPGQERSNDPKQTTPDQKIARENATEEEKTADAIVAEVEAENPDVARILATGKGDGKQKIKIDRREAAVHVLLGVLRGQAGKDTRWGQLKNMVIKYAQRLEHKERHGTRDTTRHISL